MVVARMEPPRRLDVQKDRGLRVEWADGSASFYPVVYLRRMSPSAETRDLRERMARDRLVVLPAGPPDRALAITGAEMVGNYAVRLRFSDGHHTGIYSWAYLRQIDPGEGQGERPTA